MPQCINSSRWFHMLGRCAGIPQVLGISETAAKKKEKKKQTTIQLHFTPIAVEAQDPSPHSAPTCQLQLGTGVQDLSSSEGFWVSKEENAEDQGRG